MKTLGEINRFAFHNATGPTLREDWEAAADAVVAEYEAQRWRWISEYNGDDWVHVLYDGKVYIARRDTCGGKTFWQAPSLWVLPTNINPTHFVPFPAPPKEAEHGA